VRTPALHRRVVVSGLAVLAFVLVAFNVVLYLALQEGLDASLDDVLASRADLAHELGGVYDVPTLAPALQARGIPARVTTADGQVITSVPASPGAGVSPPAPVAGDGLPDPAVTRLVTLDDGTTVEVFASRAGVATTLRRVALFGAIGTALALLLGWLLFRRSASYAIAPLDAVVAAADRTAAGHLGERLEPDEPTTRLGRMAAAYDRMLDSLEAALADTRAAEATSRRFLADAAHQLRTPLAATRSSIEALLREDDPDTRDRLLANVVREVARADRLLTALLTLARLDQGVAPEPVPVDHDGLVALCRDEVERAASLAPHLAVTCHHAEGVAGGPWLLDPGSTREILANLLDNARRHARSSIDVEVAVHPRSDGQPAGVALRIADDGSGLPADAASRVFERFVSLDGQGGSGLGLPIARTLARTQGGELRWQDSAFVLELPAGSEEPARPEEPAGSGSPEQLEKPAQSERPARPGSTARAAWSPRS
jgi:two-component system, OmpR family, sensor kinase